MKKRITLATIGGVVMATTGIGLGAMIGGIGIAIMGTAIGIPVGAVMLVIGVLGGWVGWHAGIATTKILDRRDDRKER